LQYYPSSTHLLRASESVLKFHLCIRCQVREEFRWEVTSASQLVPKLKLSKLHNGEDYLVLRAPKMIVLALYS
jgi:hypothetical protein